MSGTFFDFCIVIIERKGFALLGHFKLNNNVPDIFIIRTCDDKCVCTVINIREITSENMGVGFAFRGIGIVLPYLYDYEAILLDKYIVNTKMLHDTKL